jgi:hypothetical protein
MAESAIVSNIALLAEAIVMVTSPSLAKLPTVVMSPSKLKANLPSSAKSPFVVKWSCWRHCLPWWSCCWNHHQYSLVSLPVTLVLAPCCMCNAASISLTSLQWRRCLCSTGVGPFVAMVPAQSQHHLQFIVICCIISCLFHHIAVLGKFAHSCNVAHLGGWPSWVNSPSLAKLPSWRVRPPGSLAVMEILQSSANFPRPP